MSGTTNNGDQFLELLKDLNKNLEEVQATLPLSRLLSATRRHLHLFEGLGGESAESSLFLQRLEQAAEQKRKLAEYVVGHVLGKELAAAKPRHDGNHIDKTLFFESGSTVAYLVGILAHDLAKILKPEQDEEQRDRDARGPYIPWGILSNNLFALTAFATLVADVSVVPGSLRSKYYGFFPFFEEPPSPEDRDTRDKWKKEEGSYVAFQTLIRTCDVVFATCSSFSLLIGPLVGDRANAITKHAIHTASPHQGLFEMFHFEKLIPIGSIAPRWNMQDPKDYCQRVFASPRMSKDDINNVLSKHSLNANERDKHYEYVAAGPSNFPVKPLADQAGAGTIQERMTWGGHAPNATILVGLPNEDEQLALEFLESQCEVASDLLDERDPGTGFQRTYKVKNRTTSVRDGVAEVVFE